jgi:hypothetical protein
MENENKLYPNISKEYIENVELKAKYEKIRLQYFENDLTFITDKINHYNKLLKKWKKIDNGIKYTHIGFTSVCSVSRLFL